MSDEAAQMKLASGQDRANLTDVLAGTGLERIDTMEPMKPMKPMEPMKPMKPISGGAAWWPEGLGKPSSQGAQNSMRYAFFPEAKRLVIERDGKVTVYDSADHQISGVAQQQSHDQIAAFTSQHGQVGLDTLRKV